MDGTTCRISLLKETGIEPHLQDSNTHLKNLVESLSASSPNIINIKVAIKGLYDSYASAESKLKDDVDRLARESEDEGVQLSRTQSALRKLEGSFKNMTHKLTTLKEIVEVKKQQVDEAEDNFDLKRKEKKRKEEELEKAKNTQEGMLIATAATAWIPFVNIITAATLLPISLTVVEKAKQEAEASLQSANNALSNAHREYVEVQDERDYARRDTEDLRDQMECQQKTIDASKEKIQNIRKRLEEENQELFQLRKILKKISKLSGAAEVLKLESGTLYDVSVLYGPLKKIMKRLQDQPYAPPSCTLDKFNNLMKSRPALTGEADKWF